MLTVFATSLLLLCYVVSEDVPHLSRCHTLPPENYTCASCLQLSPSCAWCSTITYGLNAPWLSRCDTPDRLRENNCVEIQQPKSRVQLIEDAPLGSSHLTPGALMLRPQRVDVYLRPNEPVTLPVSFRLLSDYPVDLYYLMDLSHSMSDDRDKLADLSTLLVERLDRVTHDLHVGFGSFVEKPLTPFIGPLDRLAQWCPGCSKPPHSFEHRMSLTSNATGFAERVASSSSSGSLDSPEAGLTALAQSLTCGTAIGWRKASRRLVVYSSDAKFHMAGDGRLAGAVRRYDDQCALNGSTYSARAESDMDYPSLSQLHAVLAETKTSVIFAVTKQVRPAYLQLAAALPHVNVEVGTLAKDSSNIIDVVERLYMRIAERVILEDDAASAEHLNLDYASTCNGAPQRNSSCSGVRVGDRLQYNLTLTATRCPKNASQHVQDIRITVRGIPTASLVLRVRLFCACDCPNPIRNATTCNGHGELRCGECHCDAGWSGRECQCRGSEGFGSYEQQCRQSAKDDLLCEGRGRCSCGLCECFARRNPAEVISGRFCECDNFNCPRVNRQTCNGHGACVCQRCECEPGWSGAACDCPLSQTSCLASNGLLCNGRGVCECGSCVCRNDTVQYTGRTCEECVPECPNECVALKNCVQCLQFGSGPLATKCDECAAQMDVIEVDELENATTVCQFVDNSDNCTFYFTYANESNPIVWVRRHKDCPPLVAVWRIILAIIAAIVLLGLILLCCWKGWVIFYDQRQMASMFRDEGIWAVGQNPLFQPATTSFKNPAYGKLE